MTPNFFLVGTIKGGTSSLDLWLRGHPQIATPRRKEMHFFCSCPNPRLRSTETMEEYLAAFPVGKAVGESSPCYLYYPEVPSSLAAFPEARIIVSLRDPAERFWSHHLMNSIYRPSGLQPEQILEKNLAESRTNAIDDLYGIGLYGEQVARYLDVFGRRRVLVLFLEETSSNPSGAVERVVGFLGLAPLTLNTATLDKQYVEPKGPIGELFLRNPTLRRVGNAVLRPAARRFVRTRMLGDPGAKPPLPDDLRARLRDLYSEDSRRLESLLGRSLPWDWHR